MEQKFLLASISQRKFLSWSQLVVRIEPSGADVSMHMGPKQAVLLNHTSKKLFQSYTPPILHSSNLTLWKKCDWPTY